MPARNIAWHTMPEPRAMDCRTATDKSGPLTRGVETVAKSRLADRWQQCWRRMASIVQASDALHHATAGRRDSITVPPAGSLGRDPPWADEQGAALSQADWPRVARPSRRTAAAGHSTECSSSGCGEGSSTKMSMPSDDANKVFSRPRYPTTRLNCFRYIAGVMRQGRWSVGGGDSATRRPSRSPREPATATGVRLGSRVPLRASCTRSLP